MKNRMPFFLGFFAVCLFAGFNTFSQTLNPVDFQRKMEELPTASVIDVRTPDEFKQSHINNAVNINVNDNNFPSLIENLDKNGPVFVYCLSGSRSAYAANFLHNQGFKVVYDLSGGMMKWRGAGLPEISGNATTNAEMSTTQFNKLLNTDKLVLVDVYADWCSPCKIMAPFLEEIEKEMADKVKLVRINADQNKTIVKDLNATALPTLLLYKNKRLIWTNTGFQTKAEIISHFTD
jgi:thioredoxin